jgi:putative transposase
VIWVYGFTRFRASKRCAVAVLDVVSRCRLSIVVFAEVSFTQVQVVFTRALITEGKEHLLDQPLLDESRILAVPPFSRRAGLRGFGVARRVALGV